MNDPGVATLVNRQSSASSNEISGVGLMENLSSADECEDFVQNVPADLGPNLEYSQLMETLSAKLVSAGKLNSGVPLDIGALVSKALAAQAAAGTESASFETYPADRPQTHVEFGASSNGHLFNTQLLDTLLNGLTSTAAKTSSSPDNGGDGKFPFSCHICSKRFRAKQTLIRHVRLCHIGEKPFQCEICDRRFGYRHILFEHQNLHFGNRPYECKLCNKRFAARSNLVQHQSHHSKPYSCHICQKRFDTQQRLSKHVAVHPQVLMRCQHCNYMTKSQTDISQHLLQHGDLDAKLTITSGCGDPHVASGRCASNSDNVTVISSEESLDEAEATSGTTGRKCARGRRRNQSLRCNLCGQSAVNLPELNRHLMERHQNVLQHQPAVATQQPSMAVNVNELSVPAGGCAAESGTARPNMPRCSAEVVTSQCGSPLSQPAAVLQSAPSLAVNHNRRISAQADPLVPTPSTPRHQLPYCSIEGPPSSSRPVHALPTEQSPSTVPHNTSVLAASEAAILQFCQQEHQPAQHVSLSGGGKPSTLPLVGVNVSQLLATPSAANDEQAQRHAASLFAMAANGGEVLRSIQRPMNNAPSLMPSSLLPLANAAVVNGTPPHLFAVNVDGQLPPFTALLAGSGNASAAGPHTAQLLGVTGPGPHFSLAWPTSVANAPAVNLHASSAPVVTIATQPHLMDLMPLPQPVSSSRELHDSQLQRHLLHNDNRLPKPEMARGSEEPKLTVFQSDFAAMAPPNTAGSQLLNADTSTLPSSSSISDCDMNAVLDYFVQQGQLFRCQYCQILFLERGLFFLHMSLHDTQTEPFRCRACRRSCVDRNDFALHFINEHNTANNNR